MLSIRFYRPEDAGAWNALVERSKNGTFLFDRRYMDYHADRFQDASLMFFEDDSPVALLPACRTGETLISHQGLTYGGLLTGEKATAESVTALFRALNRWLPAQGISTVVIRPVPWIYHRLPAEEQLYVLTKTCGAVLADRKISSVIDLHRPVKWRHDRHYAANKARKDGITVEKNEDFPAFWRILDDNLTHRYGVHPVHSLEEILRLHAAFPDNILLYAALRDGTMLGGSVLYMTDRTVHAQYISATEEGKHLHALDALFDNILHGTFPDHDYFDFGTSVTPEDRLHESLIAWKEGFGARAVCYDTYRWDLKHQLE